MSSGKATGGAKDDATAGATDKGRPLTTAWKVAIVAALVIALDDSGVGGLRNFVNERIRDQERRLKDQERRLRDLESKVRQLQGALDAMKKAKAPGGAVRR